MPAPDLERAVAAELHRRAGEWDPDVRPLLGLPAAVPVRRAAARSLVVVAAALGVLLLVVGAAVLASGRISARGGAKPATGHPAAIHASDERIVSFHSLELRVPAQWPDNATTCGTPTTSTVVLLDVPVPLCLIQPPKKPMTVVYLGSIDDGLGLRWTTVATSSRTLDGHEARWGYGVLPVLGKRASVLVVPDADAVIAVTAPSEVAGERILSSAHVVSTADDGCATRVSFAGASTRGDPNAAPSRPLVPPGATRAAVCSYDAGWLFQGASVSGQKLAVLTQRLDELPAGITSSGPSAESNEACQQDARRGYVLTFLYQHAEKRTLTVRVGGCSALGVNDGHEQFKLSASLVDLLLSIASYNGPLPDARTLG
ncbi:MAG: hypothetical protein QOD07_1208 [Frankiaceae bacterium]|jgi:hypothetical protein|nr:hypothetical protein [Frankiaceae bacterium]